MALRNLFGQSERFIVPLFQRPYVWTQEEQWEPLWDDIQAVAERVRQAAKGEAIKGHFLGSVVLEQRSHATGGLPIREVIDGQQRLTTLQVCLHAASHAMTVSAAASAKIGQDDAARLAGLAARQVAALTRNSLVSEDEEAYKVWPTNDDRAAFREVMDATGPDAIAPAASPAADPFPRAPQSTFHDARTANEVLKAQERRLRLDERRGKLVDKARALLLVHRLAKEERDAILAWPARVAAEMASELGVNAHRLQTMMDTRLREHLAARHDVRVSVG